MNESTPSNDPAAAPAGSGGNDPPPPTDLPTRPDHGAPAPAPTAGFVRRVLAVVSISLAAVVGAVFLWYSMQVLLLAFAGVLLAVALYGSADWLHRKTRLPRGWSLAAVLLLVVAGFGTLGWMLAPSIARQADELTEKLPRSFRRVESAIRRYQWGRLLLGEAAQEAAGGDAQEGGKEAGKEAGKEGGESGAHAAPPPVNAAAPAVEAIRGADQGGRDASATGPATQSAAPQPGTSQPGTSQPATSQPGVMAKVMKATTQPAVVARATGVVGALAAGVFGFIVVLAVGIYLAANPALYAGGLLRLFPHARRPRLRQVMGETAAVLRGWMVAQLIPMGVIGALTAVGLKLIGVPLWLTLGLLAALFNFIPNFGPLISMVPAVLLALADNPAKALWVVLLFVVTQNLEGYVLTPMVQRKAIDMPEALTILVQVLMGLLLGPLGVVLAAPLLAAALVLVRRLYVEDVIGDRV